MNETGWMVVGGTISFVLLVTMIFFVIEVWTAARNVNNYLERREREDAARGNSED